MTKKMNTYILLSFLFVILSTGALLCSDSAANSVEQTDNIKVVKLKSSILNEERKVFIYLPDGYEEVNAAYPVLYILTQGDSEFKETVEEIRSIVQKHHLPELMVIGIADINGMRDLTPTRSASYGPESGGASLFLKHIKTEVIPYIDENYKTKPFRIIQGHSIVGAFCVFAFLSDPDIFDAYILSSPYFVYDDNQKYLINNTESFFTKRASQNNFLYITVGNEPVLIGCIDEFLGIVKNKKPQGVEWKYEIKKDKNHRSIMQVVLEDGLRSVFSDWKNIPDSNRR